MKNKLIILLLINNLLLPALSFQEQELKPYTRSLPPKAKDYPILTKYEEVLYPNKKLVKSSAKERLERIEIAIFGNKQTGSIKDRLNKLDEETIAWQIGSYPPKTPPEKVQPATPYLMPQTQSVKHKDYDYRLFTPLLRQVGRSSINSIFNK